MTETLCHRQAPGPSWWQLLTAGNHDEQYWALDYPLKLSKEFGEIIYLRKGKKFLITGAKAFEHIFNTNHRNYQRDPWFYDNIMCPFLGNGILVREGTAWTQRRKVALPFYQQAALKNYVPTILRLSQQLIEKWQTCKPRQISVLLEMNYLSLKIASQLMCNQTFDDATVRTLEPKMRFANRYCSQAPFRWNTFFLGDQLRFRWSMARSDRFLLGIIHARRHANSASPHPAQQPDLLDRLCSLRHEDSDRLLKESEILTEFKTHLVTGHETTACALTWMWYLLAFNPAYQVKLETELDTVLQGRQPSLADLPHLPMTRAIIDETLRLYPPIWNIPRRNQEEDSILGVTIPKNSVLLLNVHCLHRNPDYWEEPERFIPERFLTPLARKTRHAFAYLPFGAGLHRCIASHVAPMEMILITATLAQHFRFERPPGSDHPIPELCISLKPQKLVPLIPTRR